MKERNKRLERFWLILLSLVFLLALVVIIQTPSEKRSATLTAEPADPGNNQVLLDDSEIFSRGPFTLPPPSPGNRLRWSFKFQKKSTFL